MNPSDPLVIALCGRVVGLDRVTGARLWQADIRMGRAKLAIHQGVVFVAVEGGELSLLDYRTGRLLRRTSFPGSGQAPLVLADGTQVFVLAGGEVSAFSLTGDPLWHDAMRGFGNGTASFGVPGQVVQGDEY